MAGKKLVIQLEKADDKASTKVMKIVSKISGVKSIAIDDKSKKLTILCGQADPFCVVKMLRKPTPIELSWRQVKTCICPWKQWIKVEIISIEPEKEKEKVDDKKKKEEEEKKKLEEHINAIARAYYNYNYPYCLPAPSYCH